MSEPIQIPLVLCPFCGRPLDGVYQVDGLMVPPRDGDAMLCGYCASFSIFDSSVDGGARLPSNDEDTRIKNDPSYGTAIRFARTFQKVREERNQEE